MPMLDWSSKTGSTTTDRAMGQTPSSPQGAADDQDHLDQTTFRLDPVQMKAFCLALETPPFETTSNLGLDRLLAIKPPWADQGN